MAKGSGKNRGGQPTKLTAEIQAKIVKLVQAGNFRETACAAVGICPRTMRNWLRAGVEQPDSKYARFAGALAKAEAIAEARGITAIQLAGKRDWKAVAWWAEKRHQAKWGGKQTVEVSGPDGGPISFDHAVDQFARKLAIELATGEPGPDQEGSGGPLD
jgi:hypothetical protein